MSKVKEWLGDKEQQLMTRLANRTFKRQPNLLDRLALSLVRRKLGETPPDPELDHPQ